MECQAQHAKNFDLVCQIATCLGLRHCSHGRGPDWLCGPIELGGFSILISCMKFFLVRFFYGFFFGWKFSQAAGLSYNASGKVVQTLRSDFPDPFFGKAF